MKKRKAIINVIMVVSLLCVLSTELKAAPTNITNNSYEDRIPVVSAEHVAWGGEVSSGVWELFVYDIGLESTTQVTNNGGNNSTPDVDAGKLVWSVFQSGIPEVYLYDCATGITTLLTTGDLRGSISSPRISGNYVIWTGREGLGDDEVYLCDINDVNNLDITVLTANSDDESGGDIYGNYAVWILNPWPDEKKIMLYDISMDVTTQISENTSNNSDDCRISENAVVWIGRYGSSDFSAREILYYDLETSTLTRVTNNAYPDSFPEISGRNVCWEADVPVVGNEIFTYDGFNTTRITNNDRVDMRPEIGNSKVVWYCNGIHVYDINTGTVVDVTTNISDYLPDIYDSKVAFVGDDGDNEIYLVDAPQCTVRPKSDIDGNCKVDFVDLSILASEWLDCNWQSSEYCGY